MLHRSAGIDVSPEILGADLKPKGSIGSQNTCLYHCIGKRGRSFGYTGMKWYANSISTLARSAP